MLRSLALLIALAALPGCKDKDNQLRPVSNDLPADEPPGEASRTVTPPPKPAAAPAAVASDAAPFEPTVVPDAGAPSIEVPDIVAE